MLFIIFWVGVREVLQVLASPFVTKQYILFNFIVKPFNPTFDLLKCPRLYKTQPMCFITSQRFLHKFNKRRDCVLLCIILLECYVRSI